MTDTLDAAAPPPDPEVRGVLLSVYAAVKAYLREGVPLDHSLDHAGIPAAEWPAVEAGWVERLGESAAEGPTLIDASDAHRAAARAHVERALPPLDEELKAWLDFFRAFTTADDPLCFLSAREMVEGDIFRVLDIWQARIAADPAVRDAAAALFAAEPGEVPVVRAGPPRLKPQTRRTRPVVSAPPPPRAAHTVAPAIEAPAALRPAPKVPLGVTVASMPDLTKLPLPFAKQGKEPIVFEAAKPRAPRGPNPLGETKMAFTAPTKAALPFGSNNVPPPPVAETPPPPPVVPPPRSPLAETSMVGFDLAKIILPFKAGVAVLPPSTPSVPASPRSPLGGTSLAAFEPPKAALPFAAEGVSAPPPVVSPKASLAGTSLAPLGPLKAALPFAGGPSNAAPPPAAPTPRLALKTYAILHAEIAANPASALATIARHGLTPEGKRSEDAAWQARFVTDPGLRMIWMREMVAAGNRLRGGQ
jgi:hypothetical protein